MRYLVPSRTLILRAYYSSKTTSIMSGNNKQHKGPNKPSPKPKRPPLTHFLCLPLVNAISLPQLESSIESFKASIPPAVPTNSDQSQQQQNPLIPDDAIRPVGTLHLTLGVMSLPTPERFDEALRFFHSLDLAALLQNAEEIAAQKRLFAATRKRGPSPTKLAQEGEQEKNIANDTSAWTAQSLEPTLADKRSQDETTTDKPLIISLESIHVLPRARSATVLHAAPVDATSRLYPFCEALRDRFLEAGFLQGEYKNDPKKTQKEQETAQQSPQLMSSTPSQPPTTEGKREPKPRPLLLHATIVNTIYIRGRKSTTAGHGKKNHRNDRYMFDARDILAHYKNYYLDSDRTVPRSSAGVIIHRELETSGNDSENLSAEEQAKETENGPSLVADEVVRGDTNANARKGKKETTSTRVAPGNYGKDMGYPFIWARNFPIEAICICEMGAKKLDPKADESGMNARLGEKYTVVAERSLNFGTIQGQGNEWNDTDGSAEQGGVKI